MGGAGARNMGKAAIAGAAVAVVLAGAALFVGAQPFDWSARKPEIAAAIGALIGRDVEIRGPLTLALAWPLRLRAADLRIAGGAQAAAVELHVSPPALAIGDIAIEGAHIVEPALTAEPGATLDPATAANALAAAFAAADSLRRLSAVGGRIDYGAGDVMEFDLDLTAEASGDAWLAEGAALWRGIPFEGAVRVERPDAGGSAAVRARLESGAASLRFEGAFEGAAPRNGPVNRLGPADRLGLAGRLVFRGEAQDAAALLGAAATGGRMAFAPADGVRLEADAHIRYEDGAFAAEDATLRLGRASASGSLALTPGAPPRIELALSGGRLDLDALIEDSGASWSGGAEDLRFPALGFRGRIGAAFDAVAWRGRIARQAALDIELAENGAVLHRLSGALPGGSEAVLSGRLPAGADDPPFDGRVEVASDNLRTLLERFGVGTAEVPADRLRRLDLAASVAGGPRSGEIADIAARLDTVTVAGSASWGFASRPVFALALHVDRLDVDAYLPPDGLARVAEGAPPFDAQLALEFDALSAGGAAMRDVTIDAALDGGAFTLREGRIGDLAGARISATGVYAGFGDAPSLEGEIHVRADDLGALARALPFSRRWPAARSIVGAGSLDAKLAGGAEAVDFDARVALAGADLRLSGAVIEPAATPLYDIAAALESAHPALLLEALGAIDAAAAPPLLAEPLSLEAEILGGGGTVAFDAGAALGGGTWSLTGETGADSGESRFRLEAQARYPDFSRLLRLLGAPGDGDAVAAPAAPASGALTAAGTREAFSVDARFDLAGGALSFAGDVRGGETPSLEATAGFAHPATGALLAAFGLGGESGAAARPAGPVAAQARILGDAAGWQARDLDATLAGNRIAGDLALDMTAARPKLTGALTADRAAAGFFLPVRGEDGGGGAVDLSALRAVDAELSLRAGALNLYGHVFGDAEAALSLADGVLEAESLTGRLFGGAASASGKLAARSGMRLEGALEVVGMEAAEALQALAGTDSVTGRVDARFRFSTAGEAPERMLLALDGQGAFRGSGGAIEGFDLPALSAALAAARDGGRAPDFSAATAGRTAYRALGGAFEIAGGRLRAPELRLSADGAEAVVSVEANLAARRHRVATAAAFAAHEGLPPLTLYRDGPLDAPRRGVDTAVAMNTARAE